MYYERGEKLCARILDQFFVISLYNAQDVRCLSGRRSLVVLHHYNLVVVLVDIKVDFKVQKWIWLLICKYKIFSEN